MKRGLVDETFGTIQQLQTAMSVLDDRREALLLQKSRRIRLPVGAKFAAAFGAGLDVAVRNAFAFRVNNFL